jgi:Tubulin like
MEDRSMVPTLLIGVGGTGHEALTRIRRLTEEAYGKLDNFPILGFLAIDTDKEYKVSNPEAAGTPFFDHEKLHASVSGSEVKAIISDLKDFPWIADWFPSELERNISAIEAGAGQIRAYGRFALFCNYHKIQQKFHAAIARIKGHESRMLSDHQVKVLPEINVFIVGSLSGGTGSGMIVDMGYCIRHWLVGETTSQVTAIVPMPNAFKAIQVGDRVLANGYAALMELSYFSDHRNEYSVRFSGSLNDEIKSKSKPFDFTYLVGTKNGETEFSLEKIREIIAQNVFLDLTSSFAPYKRSIRDNIKTSWAQDDPLGVGYPKNFMSVGLSAIEIPVFHIHTSLAYRLSADFIKWWKNENVPLPPDIIKLVQGESFLKGMKLTEQELLSSLYYGNEKSLLAEISEFISEIRDEVVKSDRLQCTQEGVSFISAERGKILQFLAYLQPKVNEFRQTRLREESPDPRMHGSYFQKMYDNRNQIIQRGRKALDVKFYEIVEDRNYGIKFAEAFIINARQVLTTANENFRQGIEKTWQPKTDRGSRVYEDALQGISQFRDKYAGTKKADMEKRFNAALEGLEIMAVSTIQRKSRALGIEVIQRLQEHLVELERRLAKLNQKLQQLGDDFQLEADRCAESADTLTINGIKLYDREELNSFYTDLVAQLAGMTEGHQTRYEQGMESICTQLSQETLKDASPLWKKDRQADEIMRLFDLSMLQDIADRDFQEIIFKQTHKIIKKAPSSSRLNRDLSATDRLMKAYNNDEDEIRKRIGMTYNQSKPLIMLSSVELTRKDAQFTAKYHSAVAIIGGSKTNDIAAQKLVPLLRDKVGSDDNINPLGDSERHQIIFVQEVGGFSLRCIDGMRNLQQSYQDWKGQTIEAKRAKLKGQCKDVPIPVHIQKEPPFWDIFPDKPEIFELVTIARAFGILWTATNKQTQENVIRYSQNSVAETGIDNIDIGSTWEEVVQVLEIRACLQDREEIKRQKDIKIGKADTNDKKQELYQEAINYLELRESELAKLGGVESYQYRKEKDIIDRFILENKLLSKKINDDLPTTINEASPEKKSAPSRENSDLPTIVYAAPVEQPNDKVVCNCGSSNPATSKFCQECGTSVNLSISKSV